jgi:hypothetical protein
MGVALVESALAECRKINSRRGITPTPRQWRGSPIENRETADELSMRCMDIAAAILVVS